jgi:hypothetical protein
VEALSGLELFINDLEGLGQWEGTAGFLSRDPFFQFLEKFLSSGFSLSTLDPEMSVGETDIIE